MRGELVHFDEKKQTEKEREIPSAWVAEALRSGLRVELANAILTGPLDLQSTEIEQEFVLVGGEVRGSVDGFYSRFTRWVVFDRVHFHELVNFRGSRFGAELKCALTHFLKGVSFGEATIEGSFNGHDAQFGSSKGDEVDFSGCEIRGAANFRKTVFHGPAQFISMTVGKVATFDGARFEQLAAFDRAQIGGSLFFLPFGEQQVEFGGEAKFIGIKIAGQVHFTGAQFRQDASFQRAAVEGDAAFVGSEFQKVSFGGAHFEGSLFFAQPNSPPATFGGEANFHGMKVGGQAVFNGVRFDQKATFDGAEIGDLFFIPLVNQRAEFRGEAWFLGLKVGGQAGFNGARFEQKVAFDRAQIGGSLFFLPEGNHHVEFGGEARFSGTRVGGQAVFDKALFERDAMFQGATLEGGASFASVVFRGNIHFEGSRFKLGLFFSHPHSNPTVIDGVANFHGMQVEGQAGFQRARFKQGVFLEGAVFSGVSYFNDSRFSAHVSFAAARFQLTASFQGAQFHGPVYFNHARFDQEVHFPGVEFHDELKLRDARMTTLSFREGDKLASFDEKSKVDMLGCAYDRLEIDDWRKLMNRQAEFNSRPWIHLEKTLRAAGKEDDARTVYYDRRLIEGNRIPRGRLARLLVDRFERYCAGYGVHDEVFIVWILYLLLAGTVAFSLPGAVVLVGSTQESYIQENASESSGVASSSQSATQLDWDQALGFSLKQFLPVPIPVLQRYQPAPGWPSLYASFHMLFGILFVTALFTTVTGLLRRAHPD